MSKSQSGRPLRKQDEDDVINPHRVRDTPTPPAPTPDELIVMAQDFRSEAADFDSGGCYALGARARRCADALTAAASLQRREEARVRAETIPLGCDCAMPGDDIKTHAEDCAWRMRSLSAEKDAKLAQCKQQLSGWARGNDLMAVRLDEADRKLSEQSATLARLTEELAGAYNEIARLALRARQDEEKQSARVEGGK